MAGQTAALRYLDATHVLSPAGELTDFQVSDTGGFSLGKLTGFVVDPAARRLRYFVVEVARWLSKRRYLVPLCPATLEPERQTVRLDCDPSAKKEWREFDDRLFSRFSDDDLLEALFAPRKEGAFTPTMG
jgi:PRC-barrel domain protein